MSLPKGFKQLEYIQSSGTQYVDSKFVPNQDTRVVVDMNVSQSNNQQGLFGARDGSIYFELFTYTATNGYQDDYGSTQKYPVGSINYGRHILDKNKNVFSVDGIAVNTITATTFSISYSVFLLSINKDGSAYAAVPTTAKLYSCQIYDNGNLVRDFIPCQNASGAVGLWDSVNEVFYGNAGTGTFTAGPVVPEIVAEIEITELEYIQSSGTQYVDSGLKGNQNTRIDADYYTTATNGSIIGADSAWESNMCTIEVHFAAFATSSYTYSTVPSGRHTVSLNKGGLLLDGATMSTMSGTFTTPVNLTLFALNRNGAKTEYGSIKLYSMQIYDNGLLERDFIPAMLTNGEVGLYDRVFHAFYRNAGTGTFTGGPEAQTAPKAPANFRVESETDTLVTLAWDANDKAVGYRLYRLGQLLANTEETSVALTVEPFAGAVFTVTAYNENGEGAGSTLTYFSIPDNPILFLITDRTQADVTERNPKGYYAASDLNRVGYAVDYLAGRLKESGVIATVSPVLTWTDEDWATPGTMQNYLADVQTMREALTLAKTTPSVPQDMEKLTYTEANQIEMILVALDTHIRNMLMTLDAGWAMDLAYTGLYAKEAYR